MARLINDILPSGSERQRRGIRQIPVPEHRPVARVHEKTTVNRVDRSQMKDVVRNNRRALEEDYTPAEVPALELTETTDTVFVEERTGSKWWRYLAIGGGILVVTIVALFGLTSWLSYANVRLTPVVLGVTLDKENILIKLNASSTTELGYELMTLSDEAVQNLEANGEEQVNIKASGYITVYNTSLVSQRLVNNTRFESSDGRIYRINNSIVVPAGKKEAGKVVPGSIDALVYADVASDTYNMSLEDLTGDFTIPGFKGTPKYSEFYARAKTDIVGGYSGLRKKVEPAELERATAELKTILSANLIKKAYTSIPETHHLFNNAYFIEYEVVEAESSKDDEYVLKIKGTMRAVIFAENKIAEYLANKKVGKTTTLDYSQLSPRFDPDFTLTVVNPSVTPWLDKTLSVILDGQVDLVAVIDPQAMAEALVGKSQADIEGLMATYPMIKEYQVDFKPRWKKEFSTDPSDINIKIAEIE